MKWSHTLCVCAFLLALRTSFVPVLVSFAAAVLELLARSLPAVEEPARGRTLARAAVLGQPAEFCNSNKIVFSSFNLGVLSVFYRLCVAPRAPPAACTVSSSPLLFRNCWSCRRSRRSRTACIVSYPRCRTTC
jgi:hypothetical protein